MKNKDIITQRNIRKAKYAIEDFQDSKKSLLKSGLMHLLLGLVMSIGLFSEGSNLVHIIFSCLVAAGCYVAPRKFTFYKRNFILVCLISYIFLIGLEYLLVGLPSPINTTLSNYEQWEDIGNSQVRGSNLAILIRALYEAICSILHILNSLFPYIYLGLRLVFIFPFFVILKKRNILKQHSNKSLEQAGFDPHLLID